MEIVEYIEGLKVHNDHNESMIDYISKSTDIANQTIESFNSPTQTSQYEKRQLTLVPTFTSQTY